MEKKLRIVLANMPRILNLILRDIVDRQPDMAVVGEVRALAELPRAVASLRAEAVILSLPSPGSLPRVCGALREDHPGLTLLGLTSRDDRGVVWFPNASPRTIELSAATVVKALRSHPAHGRR